VKHLKIDRSFIMGLPDSADDAAITIAMVAMAKSLGLTTIAEGIETEAQHEFMQRAGCEQGQGYLYAYPLQPKEFERMLRPKHPPGGARLKLVRAVRS
jgi:EAL domain-containing protein (putative c-di-GMP-specific phosphodiesterase class I)